MRRQPHLQPTFNEREDTARKRPERPRGHRGSRPRGNPEIDRVDLERGLEKLARVVGR